LDARSIVAIEAIWLSNFLVDKSLVSSMQTAKTIARKKEPCIHKIGNHMKVNYRLFGEIIK